MSKTKEWEIVMDPWVGLVESPNEELYEQCLKSFANLCTHF